MEWLISGPVKHVQASRGQGLLKSINKVKWVWNCSQMSPSNCMVWSRACVVTSVQLAWANLSIMTPNPYPKCIQKTKKSMQLDYVCIEFVVGFFHNFQYNCCTTKKLYYYEACQIPEVME